MPEKNEKIYVGIHVRQATCQNNKFQTISKTTCQLLSAVMWRYVKLLQCLTSSGAFCQTATRFFSRQIGDNPGAMTWKLWCHRKIHPGYQRVPVAATATCPRLAMSWGSLVKIAVLVTTGDLQIAEVRHQFNCGDVTWGAQTSKWEAADLKRPASHHVPS